MFCKKRCSWNFEKFTGKHLCQSPFFNKVAGLRPPTSLKKRLWHRCFPVNFAKFLRAPFLQNTSGWLLLLIERYKPVLSKTETSVIPLDLFWYWKFSCCRVWLSGHISIYTFVNLESRLAKFLYHTTTYWPVSCELQHFICNWHGGWWELPFLVEFVFSWFSWVIFGLSSSKNRLTSYFNIQLLAKYWIA